MPPLTGLASDARRILLTGGVRSGKSRCAEELLATEPTVTYIAPGPVPDRSADPEWAARIDAHRARRPPAWRTVETSDVAAALRRYEPPFLIDCLGIWLTAVIDKLGTWDAPLTDWESAFDDQLTQLLDAWRACPGPAVAVTNEVGWGLVSEHRSGRVFTDLLGRVNQEMAAASDEVILLVAGRALRLQ
jgi:adenosylcobinamide kinase / adenosylcobinamide-phosphate guanylyltransferase